MILHLYVSRRFLVTFAIVFVALSAVYVLGATVEYLRRFGGAADMMQISRLTLLGLPGYMYRLLPLVVILSTLFLFLGFSRSSEMVVTRAAGRPALVTLMAPVLVVFGLGVVALVIVKPIIAATSHQSTKLIQRLNGSDVSTVSVSDEGLWLRQGDANGQTVIHAGRVSPDGLRLTDVSFFGFSSEGVPVQRIKAEVAQLETGRWALTNAKVWDLRDLTNPEHAALVTKRYYVASSLTPERITGGIDDPSVLPIWELPRFIRQLRDAGFSTRRHQVWFQSELAMPFFLMAMAMIGGAFTMRHTRLGHTGLLSLFAVLFGFGIYFIRNFATILGENGQIPVAVAAWTPPITAMMLALGIILHLEDG